MFEALIAVLLRQLPGILLTFALSFFVLQPIARTTGLAEGRQQGRAALQSEIATAAAQAEKERVSDDAALSKLDDYALCVRGLRAQRMPDDACQSLRRLPAERAQPGGNGGVDPGR